MKMNYKCKDNITTDNILFFKSITLIWSYKSDLYKIATLIN